MQLAQEATKPYITQFMSRNRADENLRIKNILKLSYNTPQ